MNIFFSTLKILRLFYSFRIFAKNIGKKLIVKILRNFYNLFTLWLFLRIYFYGHLKKFQLLETTFELFWKNLEFCNEKESKNINFIWRQKKIESKIAFKKILWFQSHPKLMILLRFAKIKKKIKTGLLNAI